MKKLFHVFTTINHNDFEKLGGQHKAVEIDESVMKSKYNRGRPTKFQRKSIWVLGVVSRNLPKRFFATRIYNRQSLRIDKVITKVVNEGTTIYTDKAAFYKNLPLRQKEFNFTHKSVNHSENFVDLLDPETHTQSVENRWRWLKKRILSCRTLEAIDGYIEMFIYRNNYFDKDLRNTGNNFKKVCLDIGRVHPHYFDGLTCVSLLDDDVKNGSVDELLEEHNRKQQRLNKHKKKTEKLLDTLRETATKFKVPVGEEPVIYTAKAILKTIQLGVKCV